MAGFRGRIIIPESMVPQWMGGHRWEDLNWKRCPDPAGVLIVKDANGWGTCQVHGFEQLFIADEPVVQKSSGRGRRLYLLVKSRESFVLEDLIDGRIYEREFSIRDEGDRMPEPQLAAVVDVGRRSRSRWN